MRGQVQGSIQKRKYNKRHNWMVNRTKGIGPMEVEFEIASNLFSLNIDVMFVCQDAKKIADSPEKNTEEA